MRLTRLTIGAGILLLVLALPAPASGNTFLPGCLISFANTSENGTPEAITVITYLELIDKVAQGRVSRTTLEKLIAAQNPFEIPEQDNYDLGGLRTQMKRFEELLRQKAWFTPPVLEAIHKKLNERHRAMLLAEAGLETTVKGTEGDFVVPLPRPDGMTESPDGSWLVSTNRQNTTPETAPWTMNLYDLKERKLARIPGSNLHLDRPHFSPDGKLLLFPAPGYRLYTVPFHVGKPDWDSGKYIGEKFGDGRGNRPHFGKDPNLVIAGAHTNYLFLYDLRKGTSVRLGTTRHHAEREWGHGGASVDFGIVPGTNDLFLRTKLNSALDRMRVFSVQGDGTLKLKETLWERSGPPGTDPEEKWERHTFFLPDGTPVTSWAKNNEPGLNFYVGKDLKKIRMDFPAEKFTPAKVTPNDNLIVHPTKPEVALLYHNENRTKYFAVHFNLEMGRVLGSYELPERSQSITFSPGGERIYAQPWARPMHSLNYRQRLLEENESPSPPP